MSEKWNLFVDVEKCNGCRNCFLVVKDEYVGNAEPGYFAPQPLAGASWFSVDYIERGEAPFTDVTYLPRTCQHCDDPPCLKAAKNGAVTKRPDGIVIIDPEKARGQKAIVDACPYHAVTWNEELQLPQAWPFDAHLLDRGWTKPRVEQACPTGALSTARIDNSVRAEKIRTEGWRPLRPDLTTGVRVHYRGLQRIETIFLSGTIEVERAGVRDCREDVKVELLRDGVVVATTLTDGFGEFKIDGLAAAAGHAVVRITLSETQAQERAMALESSENIGRLVFQIL